MKPEMHVLAKAAILALDEIKAATEAFDAGATNVFDAMDAIATAVEAYHDVVPRHREAA